jgi:hypothetical protein
MAPRGALGILLQADVPDGVEGGQNAMTEDDFDDLDGSLHDCAECGLECDCGEDEADCIWCDDCLAGDGDDPIFAESVMRSLGDIDEGDVYH